MFVSVTASAPGVRRVPSRPQASPASVAWMRAARPRAPGEASPSGAAHGLEGGSWVVPSLKSGCVTSPVRPVQGECILRLRELGSVALWDSVHGQGLRFGALGRSAPTRRPAGGKQHLQDLGKDPGPCWRSLSCPWAWGLLRPHRAPGSTSRGAGPQPTPRPERDSILRLALNEVAALKRGRLGGPRPPVPRGPRRGEAVRAAVRRWPPEASSARALVPEPQPAGLGGRKPLFFFFLIQGGFCHSYSCVAVIRREPLVEALTPWYFAVVASTD